MLTGGVDGVLRERERERGCGTACADSTILMKLVDISLPMYWLIRN
jgi:hypothetical protein